MSSTPNPMPSTSNGRRMEGSELEWKEYTNPEKTNNTSYFDVLSRQESLTNSVSNFESKIPNVVKLLNAVDCDVSDGTNFSTIPICFADNQNNMLSLTVQVLKCHMKKKSSMFLIYLHRYSARIKFHYENGSLYAILSVKYIWLLICDFIELIILQSKSINLCPHLYRHFLCKMLLLKELQVLQLLRNAVSENSNRLCFQTEVINKKQPVPNSVNKQRTMSKHFTNLSLKREFDYLEYKTSENSDSVEGLKKYCSCKEIGWSQFKKLRKVVISNYECILSSAIQSHNSKQLYQTSLTQALALRNKLNLSISNQILSSDKRSFVDGEVVENKASVKSENSCNVPRSTTTTENAFCSPTVDKIYKCQKFESVHSKIPPKKHVEINVEVAPSSSSSNVVNQKTDLPLFRTASGKSISVSNTALISAQKMYQEVCTEESIPSFHTASGKSIPVSNNALKSAQKMYQEVCVEETIPSFHTASGKSISISNSALKSAQKMYQKVCFEDATSIAEMKESIKSNKDKKSHSALNTSTREVTKNEPDYDLEKTLGDNFFDDIPFFENEDSPTTSSVATTLPPPKSGKIRKSLGGRRFLKPYSKKN